MKLRYEITFECDTRDEQRMREVIATQLNEFQRRELQFAAVLEPDSEYEKPITVRSWNAVRTKY